MLPEDGVRLIWLGVLVLALGVIGMGVILALLSSWRNQGRREKLLEQGRQLRASQPHNRARREAAEASADAWAESGRRHQDDDDPGDDIDMPAEGDDDDDRPQR
ncbi:hypothetical protein ACERK3_09895 [Phycisphaerales bacterium AB-hyl4]|uniref:LapA family protein n=1 Tax=Natronomicrosphaera hydrolytica TaxID=3242702 RepID=A0ABV4U4S7_9BACT